MATKKANKKVEKKEVSRKTLSNGFTVITYDDGSMEFLFPSVILNAEEVNELFGKEEEEEEEELTGEALAEMDFEELEDVCDDKDLDTDPDDYEEEDIEKFRKSIAKELGITLPKAKETKKAGKGKKK